MIFSEEKGNLFGCDKKYYLAHCIAEDAHMGAGIAVLFTHHFPEIKRLRKMELQSGTCILVGGILNLITKKRSSGKPSYQSLTASLTDCKNVCDLNKIKFIAMPKIGCGLDRLQWPKVREIIKNIFNDTDVEIKIYHL